MSKEAYVRLVEDLELGQPERIPLLMRLLPEARGGAQPESRSPTNAMTEYRLVRHESSRRNRWSRKLRIVLHSGIGVLSRLPRQ